MTKSSLAIVIPAWNEERVIGDCLAALVNQHLPGAVTITVIANGCSDRTAEAARAFCAEAARRGIEMIVAERDAPGKPAALNFGDELCPPSAHRLYLDADVRLSQGALVALAAAFETGTQLAAPALRLDDSNAPALCRGYWRCWAALPNVQGQVLGAGAYGVSAQGRAKWDCFPEVIADDLYARSHFAKHETAVLDNVSFSTAAPDSIRGTLRMLTRWRRGNVQLSRLASAESGVLQTSKALTRTSLRHVLGALRPHVSARDVAAFACITAIVRTLTILPTILPTQDSQWKRGR